MERKFRSRPHGVDGGDLLSIDRVGERPGANAIDIATVINKTASGFDGLLGAWMLRDVRCRVFAILNVPHHGGRHDRRGSRK